MKVEEGLLMYWWHYYYDEKSYTSLEYEEFKKIIKKYGADKVIDAGVASYLLKDGSPYLILLAIRANDVEGLFNILPDISKMEEKEREHFQKTKLEFIEKISKGYK